MLREALDQAGLMRLSVFFSQMTLWLGEARLLAGAIDEANELASTALEATRERQEAGLEAWALRLAADIATHRAPRDVARGGEPLPAGEAASGGAWPAAARGPVSPRPRHAPQARRPA